MGFPVRLRTRSKLTTPGFINLTLKGSFPLPNKQEWTSSCYGDILLPPSLVVSERMTDVTTNRTGFNNVEHLGFQAKVNNSIVEVQFANGGHKWFRKDLTSVIPENGIYANTVQFVGAGDVCMQALAAYKKFQTPTRNTVVEGQLENQCLVAANPTFKPDLNLLNTCRELIDIRSLFTSATLKLAQTRLRKGPSNFNRRSKKKFWKMVNDQGISKKTATEYLKAFSSDYLMFSFGWFPLIGEIQTINASMKRVTHLLRMQKGKFEPVLQTAQTRARVLTSSSSGVSWSIQDGQYPFVFSNQHKSRLKTSVSLKFRHKRPDPSFTDEIKMRASVLGLHCIAGTLWEAIPFSFMVDWFLPVGQLIERADAAQEFDARAEILQVSITHAYTNAVESRLSDFCSTPVVKQPLVVSGGQRIFVRKGTDDPQQIPGISEKFALGTGMNGKRYSYVAAIAAQKLR